MVAIPAAQFLAFFNQNCAAGILHIQKKRA
jgi:hypothetical protein